MSGANKNLSLVFPSGPVERVIRRFRLGEEPSMVDEYAHLGIEERFDMFLDLRNRVIKSSYETEPGFERVLRIARLA